MNEARVIFDDEAISRHFPDSRVESVRWDDLQEVAILTTEDGPWAEDIFWMLAGTESGCAIPSSLAGFEALLSRLQQLPGFDNEAVIAAMGCTEAARFLCWQKETPLSPARLELQHRLQSAPPAGLLVFAVLEEDSYETLLGDGYYAYFREAFFGREQAEEFAVASSGEWQRFHVKEVLLRWEEGEYRFSAKLLATEKIENEALVASLVKRL